MKGKQMRALTVILIGLIFSCSIIFTSQAEEFKDQEYLAFVEKAKKESIGNLDNFRKLRDLYVQTSFYDPFFPPSEIRKIIKKLNSLRAVENRTQEEDKEFDQLFYELFNQGEKHLAHIDSHVSISTFLLPFDQDLAKRFAFNASAIAKIVTETGDGLSAETAYKAINKNEQHFILNYILKRQYNNKSTQNIDGKIFDVYHTYPINSETRETDKDIYFDITEQMARQGKILRGLKQKIKEKEEKDKNDTNGTL